MTQTNLFAEQLDVNPNPKIQVVEKYILTALNNFSTIFPYVETIFPIILSLIFLDPRGALFSAGAILNVVINIILKIMIKQSRPAVSEDFNRFCDTFPSEDIPKSIDYGMPSGHGQSVGFLLGFMMMKMYNDGTFDVVPIVTLVTILSIVCWSRVNKKCHTIMQVSIGAIIGTLFGVGYYKLISKFYEKFNKNNENNGGGLCIASDDNEYKCETIKDGYVINDAKETFVDSKAERLMKQSEKLSERQFQETFQPLKHKMSNETFVSQVNNLHNIQNTQSGGENIEENFNANILNGLNGLNVNTSGNSNVRMSTQLGSNSLGTARMNFN
tara:strand:- start:1455 stop:2438 length:984 start_codon:yes stop_codon:yes gene_type:complete